ncbi:dopamine D2-like receptor [Agrilus planipennis]|uniref:Dopamine D2-like receptor n=1 Tax=Agrilus planipennis TaxID=224129 RepID=A0A7F5RFQ1_AGRPL|nr:dopamine D2-like receptor [Agrilus planipennis]
MDADNSTGIPIRVDGSNPQTSTIKDVGEMLFNSSTEFLFLFDDVDQYLNRVNYSGNDSEIKTSLDHQLLNCSQIVNDSCAYRTELREYNYWALLLVVFPIFTLFGNVLVILSVYRERTLQTITNYFIVSLALADLLVAVVVMPFAVYVLVNGAWALPSFVCDFYIAMDVTCSTSSIFNLVAISIDRYYNDDTAWPIINRTIIKISQRCFIDEFLDNELRDLF